MFNLGNFIKGGLVAAVGKMADYQIVLNAAGWFEKGVLTENDLAEIQTKIDEKTAAEQAAAAVEDVPIEDTGAVDEGECTKTLQVSSCLLSDDGRHRQENF